MEKRSNLGRAISIFKDFVLFKKRKEATVNRGPRQRGHDRKFWNGEQDQDV